MLCAGARRQIDKCAPDDPDTLVNTGCVMFKEGAFEGARAKFNDALGASGYQVCAQQLGTRCAAVHVNIWADPQNVYCAMESQRMSGICAPGGYLGIAPGRFGLCQLPAASTKRPT